MLLNYTPLDETIPQTMEDNNTEVEPLTEKVHGSKITKPQVSTDFHQNYGNMGGRTTIQVV